MKKIHIRYFNILIFAIITATLLGSIAGHQFIGTSRDYENYLNFFQFAQDVSIHELLTNRFEPGFMLISKALVDMNISGPWTYSIIAALCIFLKIYVIRSCKHFFLAASVLLIFYFLRYFTLFEMTVLRATVASSLAFFVFFSRNDTKYNWQHVALLMLAVSMHYSAIIYFLIYLYVPKKRIELLVLTIILFFGIFILKNIVVEFLSQYISLFNEVSNMGASTFLPKPTIIDILFVIFMLSSWQSNDFQMKTAAYGAIFGLVLHFALIDMTVLAGRFRELMSIFYLIYIVKMIDNKNPNYMKLITFLFILVSGFAHLYVGYIHDPLLS